MVEFHTDIVAALEDVGIPVFYELFLDNTAPVPCISYQEIENAETHNGNTIGYSRSAVRVKVWAKNVEDLLTYSSDADEAMCGMGFRRRASNEVTFNSILCKVLDYEGTYAEEYDTRREY